MTDVERLRLAIQRSGLSNRKWATTIAQVTERTVRRWLAGDCRISARVSRIVDEALSEDRCAT